MSVKDNLLTILKLQTACFYHTNSKSYKLLNVTTLKKTLYKVRISSFYNTACNPICMLLNTIYEHTIDKQDGKGIIYIFFWCKISF